MDLDPASTPSPAAGIRYTPMPKKFARRLRRSWYFAKQGLSG
jgi:hypothetical protein